ncbi:MAG TPA: arsenate reductase ArsC [Candidatus Limnocylindria bacterium]|jgi:arsenate reductase|nr:arsenate reductase ArsC [Candidatus Limnocylindria bacterium]
MPTQRVLFLCTHNSARSQMAEGLLRHYGAGGYQAFSAGTEATAVRREAVAVMAEVGIDISGQKSKTLDGYFREPFDWAITVCDSACKACPVLPGATRRAHWDLDDPAAAVGSMDERLAVFRRVRNELDSRVRAFVKGDR